MSLEERLADWRNPEHWDEPPTEEQVLRQFLYSAVAHFIEEHEKLLLDFLMESEEPECPFLAPWIDEYADRSSSQPDGYERVALPVEASTA